jgi:hypothetical protein
VETPKGSAVIPQSKQTQYSALAQTPPPPPAAPPPPPPAVHELKPIAPLPSPVAIPLAPKVEAPLPPPPTPTITLPTLVPSSNANVHSAQSTTTISPPTQSNIIVGQISNPAGSALEGAIVEITDSGTNIPARALRTNRLGQFQIATPLPSGTYIISVEKDGYFFSPVSVKVGGGITPPIVISAQTVA